MLRWRPASRGSRVRASLAIAVAAALSACAEPTMSKMSRSTGDSTDSASDPPDGDDPPDDSDEPVDTGPPVDTATPIDPDLYCRSLDPNWASAYVDPLDVALAEVIAARELLGDPTLYVDTDGTCRRRDLPTIELARAQLGRALFFSVDLSGDRDVACATCHHPELGGADALTLPLGPGHDPLAVGEDRAGDTTRVDQLQVARNAPSVLNVALWDHRLMWDGRVEAVDPEAGFGGSEGGITTPDGPADAADLVAAQALMPIEHPHEMGGSLADRVGEGAPLLDAIVSRLAEDADWQAAFESVCEGDASLPPSWTAACAEPDTSLVTAAHMADALSVYQRSLVFVDTPWSAYVRGDVTALSDSAKEGALAFYRTPAEGGLNCGTCHTGDFFTDELVHAVGSPQIGPGDPLGEGTAPLDRGRLELTGDPADAFAFRTPSLLNVDRTPPYFHSGSVNDLFWAVLHYRGVQESVSQAFGFDGEPARRAPPWCGTALFAGIDGCEALYNAETTHGGDLDGAIAGEVVDIEGITDVSTDLVVLFLEALTDPRVTDAEALAPYVETGAAVPVTTPTSDTWSETCQQMVEWPLARDLRVKGARWLAKGTMPPRTDVNTDVVPSSVFGLAYWDIFGRRYALRSGLSRRVTNVAIGVLALMSVDERAALMAAWTVGGWTSAEASWRTERETTAALLTTWRQTGDSVDAPTLSVQLASVHTLESEGIQARAEAYGAAWWPLTATERTERRGQLRRFLDGDLSELPTEVVGSSELSLPRDIRDELALRGIDLDAVFASYVLGYAAFTAGPDCTGGFDPRQDTGSVAGAYFGFGPWIDRTFFDLQSGTQEPVSAQIELAELLADLEATAGAPGPDPWLTDAVAARRAWQAARSESAAAARAVALAVATGADRAAAEQALIQAAAATAAAETDLLVAEVGYFFSVRDGLSTGQLADVEAWIDCIESPEVQSLKDNGGFDAIGGGSCLP